MQRLARLRKTEGMPIHTTIRRGLLKRQDWIDLLGAVYPNNQHLWGQKKNGRVMYIGQTYHAEKRYVKVADRG